MKSPHIHELFNFIAEIGIEIARIGRTTGRGRKGIATRLPTRTSHRGFFTVVGSIAIKKRPGAVENSDIIIDRVNFIVVHDRDADITSIHPARCEGIHDRGPFRKLHGGGVIDLRSIEKDFVLTELHIQEREVGAENIIIQKVG